MVSFSICIPVYNSASLLEGALCSVRNQKYPSTKCEILVCEQVNKDAEPLCKKYNARFIYLSNKSTYNARKLMMNEAIGEYIIFLDSDDKLKDNSLSLLNDVITKTKYLDLYEFNFIDNLIRTTGNAVLYTNKRDYLLKILSNSTEMYKHNNVSTKCLKKVINNYEDRDMYNYEDGYFLFQLINDYYNTFYCISDCLYIVNKETHGSSKTQTIEKLKNMIFYNLKVLDKIDPPLVIPLIDDTLSNIFNTLILIKNNKDIKSFTKDKNTKSFLKLLKKDIKIIRKKVVITKQKYITVILMNSFVLYKLINKLLKVKHAQR